MKKIIILLITLFVNTTLFFAQTGNVKVIYNYLYVFPNELGFFESSPTNVIYQLNSQSAYGYNCWRIPTNEELALIRANGCADPQATYITSDGSNNGRVLLVTTKNEVETKIRVANEQAAAARKSAFYSRVKAQTGYIDLGLSSRTKWAAQNYAGGSKDTFDHLRNIVSLINIPSQRQWMELRRECTWTWSDEYNGFFIEGKNGNAIFLGATNGFLMNDANGRNPQCNRRKVGFYWSTTNVGERHDRFKYYVFTFDGDQIASSSLGDSLYEDDYACLRCVSR